ncbi:MAG TPA: tyrosine--tRNA ligase [Vicinamibacterales bacterium]|jgi:tyrosyl-tRNA synthetase|nr:tyrosine--tRNA ligase [Vicinamibacterales bacterium]
MSDVFLEFEWRGQLANATDGARELLAREKVSAYIGFDPSASSLHVGTLVPIVAMKRLQRFGHSPIALLGGGTGLIGDPSGKTVERMLLSADDVRVNVEGVRAQLSKLLEKNAEGPAVRFVDNADWLTRMSAMEFLRDVGKYFTVNYLLAKDSVNRRLESEDGISFTEFSYSLLQAYDFLVLHDRFKCTLQLGGSDQWGNIVAGCDLIRKLRGKPAHGVVMPLLTTSSGTKFGKTEAGTIWLDAGKTSPFRFYQFWLNADDRDVVSYLKYFTFRTQPEIGELEQALETRPEQREAQRALARDVTELVHGTDHVVRAERAAAVLFGGPLAQASVDDILMVFDDAPSITMAAGELDAGVSAAEMTVRTGLAASKAEAGRLIKQGGLYVNDRRFTDERGVMTMADAISRSVIVLRKGQRERRIVKIQE